MPNVHDDDGESLWLADESEWTDDYADDPAPETFTLTIRLGNDAMQTPADIARALRDIAGRIGDSDYPYSQLGPHEGTIRDINGNRVGDWNVR